jgi:hypothetical protein
MGKLRNPLRFVCLACGKQCETFNSGNKGKFCGKPCRADFDRKGCDAPRRYKQAGYWMLCWTVPGGTRRRPIRRSIFEHRKVWEDANGPVPEGHVIHHVNGDKSDNRIENLQLMQIADHVCLHRKGRPKRKMAE